MTQFDSVFLAGQPFTKDRPFMSTRQIQKGLDKVESEVVKGQSRLLDLAIEALTKAGFPLVDRSDLKSIQSLELPQLKAALQAPILQSWVLGFDLGQDHGKLEIKNALPPEDRATFSLSERQRMALIKLLGEDNSTLKQVNAEQSILQRALRLSGNFADDMINRIKADLIASIIPQSDGLPISRDNLVTRIENTLGIGQRRAEMIARTETTNAYNAGRLTSYKQSRIVSHVRFLAILDNRTSDICSSRNGLVWEIGSPEVEANRPPLHPNCRSVLSPLMPSINEDHLGFVEDPNRDPTNKTLPSLEGWN